MVEILPFPEEAGRRDPDLGNPGPVPGLVKSDPGGIATTSSQTAEVVIFPGIRVERQKFTLADRLPGRGAGNPRKKDGNPHHSRG